MSYQNFFSRFCFIGVCSLLLSILGFFLFYPIYTATSIIIPYSLHPYDICLMYPLVWKHIKYFFIFLYLTSSALCSNAIFSQLRQRKKVKSPLPTTPISLETPSCQGPLLFLGKNESHQLIFLPEKSLYQNILITGTIGTGKTSSCMYPFTKQLLQYRHSSLTDKLGMLILDVKGNYYQKVLDFARSTDRLEDVYVIGLTENIRYNPLDKPNLKPSVLANRLKTILTLFSPSSTEPYWLDKAEQVIAEAIKLCRLYNNGYVTFVELHKLISLPDYYLDKLDLLKEIFLTGNLSQKECYDALSSIEFFEKEFFQLDGRTLSILKSEITRITNCFISDYDVLHTFCPAKEEINFHGFKEVMEAGKIVVFNMNIAEYRNLAKIMATYLKLDFQTEVLARLGGSSSCHRSVVFICDEFQEYITTTDADFFSQSREAKCINIVATQSYSSLLNSLSNSHCVKTILQNLINKLWFRTDDIETIEEIQKQIGKEDKEKISKTISENSSQTNYSYFTSSFHSIDSNISESLNQYQQTDFIYDTNFFTQHLETFSCLGFLSDGYHILKPMKLQLTPYFSLSKNL